MSHHKTARQEHFETARESFANLGLPYRHDHKTEQIELSYGGHMRLDGLPKQKEENIKMYIDHKTLQNTDILSRKTGEHTIDDLA